MRRLNSRAQNTLVFAERERPLISRSTLERCGHLHQTSPLSSPRHEDTPSTHESARGQTQAKPPASEAHHPPLPVWAGSRHGGWRSPAAPRAQARADRVDVCTAVRAAALLRNTVSCLPTAPMWGPTLPKARQRGE